MIGYVTIDTSLNLRLDDVLLESELTVLEDAGEKAVRVAKSQWTDWKYVGVDKTRRGNSLRGWRFELMQTGTSGLERGVKILNEAKTQAGKPYARWVHRAGKSVTSYSDNNREWLKVMQRIKAEVIPQTVKDLKDEIIKNAGVKRTRKSFRTDNQGVSAHDFDILSQSTF